MQESFLISFIVNVILMITILYSIFKNKITRYFKERAKKRRAAKASKLNLEKAYITKVVRKEVRSYLEELKKS